jgi:hypothetical protein
MNYFVDTEGLTQIDNPMADSRLFGNADARNSTEIDGLKSYFLEMPYYSQIEIGAYSIVVGRKGSGKSAIKTKLLERQPGYFPCEIECLLPTHKLFQLYGEINGVPNGSYSTYEKAWVAYIIGSIFLRLRDEGISWGSNADIIRRAVHRIGLTNEQKFVDRITKLAVGFEKLGTFSAEASPSTIFEHLPSEAALIDRVDQGLETQFTADSFVKYKHYAGGLCSAVAFLNSKISQAYLTIYAFIRTDLYDQIAIDLHSVTEFESLVCRLDWKYEALTDIIGKRICAYFGKPKYLESQPYQKKQENFRSSKIFHRVVEPHNIDSFETWFYILFNTQLKPRDCITLLDFCRKAAEQASKSIIVPSHTHLSALA